MKNSKIFFPFVCTADFDRASCRPLGDSARVRCTRCTPAYFYQQRAEKKGKWEELSSQNIL